MSEFNFGVTPTTPHRAVTKAEATRRDKRASNIGGRHCGYIYAHMPDGWRGWYYAPQRGEPFDSRLAREIMDAREVRS